MLLDFSFVIFPIFLFEDLSSRHSIPEDKFLRLPLLLNSPSYY